jgi:hypothetical protein
LDVYLTCAVVGGAVLALQFVFLLFGGDAEAGADGADLHGADSPGDGGADGVLRLLSIRTVAAFVTFFGLVGWLGHSKGWGEGTSLVAAMSAGGLMMGLVAWLFAALHRLQSSGNVDPAQAVGRTARVYLRIPGGHSGKGKITVSVQGRARQYEAETSGSELATGSDVLVVRMTSPGTFEVAPAEPSPSA